MAKSDKKSGSFHEKNGVVVFKTAINGFDKTEVNLYVSELKKTIRDAEIKYAQLEEAYELANKGFSQSGDVEGDLRRCQEQVIDLTEQLSNEKEASAVVERECLRLQNELEMLRIDLINSGGTVAGGEKPDYRKLFGNQISMKINAAIAELQEIDKNFRNSNYSEDEGSFDDLSDLVEMVDSEEISSEPVRESAVPEEEPTEPVEEEVKEVVSTINFDAMDEDTDPTLINQAKVVSDSSFAEALMAPPPADNITIDEIYPEKLDTDDGFNISELNPVSIDKGADLTEEAYEIFTGEGVGDFLLTPDEKMFEDDRGVGNMGFIQSVDEESNAFIKKNDDDDSMSFNSGDDISDLLI